MNSQYKDLSDKAYLLHKAGKLDEAETIYLKLLQVSDSDVNILNLLGMLYISKNNAEVAIKYLSKAYILNKSVYIAANLGKAFYYNNEYKKAVEIYLNALKKEQNDDLYYSLAIAYKALGEQDKVIASYEKAVKCNPKNYNALYNLVLAYKSVKDITNAINTALLCLKIKRDDDILSMLSELYEDINNYESAINSLEEAVTYRQNYLYYYNLGVLYSKVQNIKMSKISYEKSIQLNPEYPQAYANLASLYKDNNNEIALNYLLKAYELNSNDEKIILSLAQTYKDIGDNQKSIDILNKAVFLYPNSAEAYSLMGTNYMDIGNYSEALKYYNKAITLSPENPNYLHGKAIAYKYLGNIEECKKILEYIVKNHKDCTQSEITLGMIYLTDREFEKGMKLYRLRSKDSKFNLVFKDKIWDDDIDITNKDMLVYSDCGLGDTIMYSRFLPILKKNVKTLTLQTDKELLSVLRDSFNNIKVIKKGETPPKYDYVIPMMDIQYLLNIDFNNIPSSDGYLKAKNVDFNFNTRKKKIGLFWQGNKKIFKNRSVDFKYIDKIISNSDNEFYSFQIEFDIEERNNFHSLKKYINDYSDTAALLKQMDLLITIDSSIAHMAGALGVKTYLMLPYTAEWRWFDDKEKTVWYNSIRIFKQKVQYDWEGVTDEIIKSL